jgi:hypothetical protein
MARYTARRDPALSARVVERRELRYASADPAEDRPAFVRSGSALARFGRRLAVIQDDAHFVALVDPRSLQVEPRAFARGEGGARLFDDSRGNKAHKLDLEACVVLGDTLIAFGSGSTPRRARLLVMRQTGEPEIVDAPELYAALRAAREFAGAELNVEGAVAYDDGRLVLFQRGNGRARDGLDPVDATCELRWSELVALIEGRSAKLEVERVKQYDLGEIAGVRLTFTDAARLGTRALFLAAAEASPDVTCDGPVFGVAVGVIEEDGAARHTAIVEASGQPFTAKAEGLWVDADEPTRGFVVIDADDPDRASELCVLELEGFRPG